MHSPHNMTYTLKNLFQDVSQRVGRPKADDGVALEAQWIRPAFFEKNYFIHIQNSGIANYQDNEKLAFYAGQIFKRDLIVKTFALAEPSPLANLVMQLQEHPLSADVPLFNKTHWRDGGSTTTRSVHPLLLSDVEELHRTCFPNDKVNMPSDELLLANYGDSYTGRLVIDLSDNDRQIKKDFQAWLENARRQAPQLAPLSHQWKSMQWRHALALVDLYIWAKFHGRTLTSTQICQAIPSLTPRSLPTLKRRIQKSFTFQEAVKMRREGWRLANP